jgi:hypothetical protein
VIPVDVRGLTRDTEGSAFGVEAGRVPYVFSPRTLGEFEAASASILLRPLDRAFEGAHIRLGEDPGGPAGTRRIQFRRYIASIDQQDPQQLDRLGAALGALIGEVAASKVEFLVNAAERDGFVFADGVFRPAERVRSTFAVTSFADVTILDDRARRLRFLANDRPAEAIDGARSLVESVCLTLLRLAGQPAPAKTVDLIDIAESALGVLDLAPSTVDAAKTSVARIRTDLARFVAVLASVAELRNARYARLAVGAAVTFAGFVLETYAEQYHDGHRGRGVERVEKERP